MLVFESRNYAVSYFLRLLIGKKKVGIIYYLTLDFSIAVFLNGDLHYCVSKWL